MAYLGNTPNTQSFIAGTDVFNGTGAQVTYTLTRSINSPNDIEVVVNNVEQDPSSYSAAGTLMTFSAAPSSGTGNIYVRYLSTTLQSVAPGQKTVVPASLSTGGPYWDASGNVGIGTTSPAAPLDVRAGAGTGNISGPTSGTWAAKIVMNEDTSGYSGLSIQNRWANSLTPILEVAKGYNGLNAGYYPVFSVKGDGTIQSAIDNSGLFPMQSCRAWVNFNGTGTVAIRASGNVSSITDWGVGTYGINFITAMPDANYSYSHAYSNEVNVAHGVGFYNSSSASQLNIAHYSTTNSGALVDKSYVLISIFR